MEKKKGFTLVELLAVIVILAIILVIAVPQIMDTIDSARDASIESSAKMIAAQVENQHAVSQTFGTEFDLRGDCTNEKWAGLNKTDYVSCTYNIDSNGKAHVTLVGANKFDGKYVCEGTKTNASVNEDACEVYVEYGNAVAYIENLYGVEEKNKNGLIRDNTVDRNIRYSGNNNVVRNYVEFGNDGELWRIIGIFNINGVKRVKIVREDSIGYMIWDSSASTVNDGYGINQWGDTDSYEGADLMRILNNEYLARTDVPNMCYNWDTETAETCSFSEIGLSSRYIDMIDEVEWNTGAININDTNIVNSSINLIDTVKWYNAERGNIDGKYNCSSGKYCNDNVARTTSWVGKVALPYVTDYAYASSESGCHTNMKDGFDVESSSYANMSCKKNNWMHYGIDNSTKESTRMLSPVARTSYANFFTLVNGYGAAGFGHSYLKVSTRPSVYLNYDIKIIDGDGSRKNPFILERAI